MRINKTRYQCRVTHNNDLTKCSVLLIIDPQNEIILCSRPQISVDTFLKYFPYGNDVIKLEMTGIVKFSNGGTINLSLTLVGRFRFATKNRSRNND